MLGELDGWFFEGFTDVVIGYLTGTLSESSSGKSFKKAFLFCDLLWTMK